MGKGSDTTMQTPRLGPELGGQKILVVGLQYSPGYRGIAPCSWQVCQDLQRRGASVQVMTGMPDYPQAPAVRGSRLSTDEVAAGVRVNRLRFAVPPLTARLKRGGYEATFGAHVLAHRLPWKPDVVVAVVPSLLAAMAAARIARRAGARLVVWVQEFMGPAAAKIGLDSQGYGARATARIEGRLLRQADVVLVVNDDVRRYVEAAGVANQRIVIRPEWTHLELSQSVPTSSHTRALPSEVELALAEIAGVIAS